MIEKEEYERFCRLRNKLATVLNRYDKAHHHENDGIFKISIAFPSIYHDLCEKAVLTEYEISLMLYLDDDDPHARWWGHSLNEALLKCEEDIERLIDSLKREANRNV